MKPGAPTAALLNRDPPLMQHWSGSGLQSTTLYETATLLDMQRHRHSHQGPSHGTELRLDELLAERLETTLG